MVRWLLRKLLGTPERDIFKFWDGSKLRRVDPVVVYRALHNHPEFDWEVHPELLKQGGDVALDALRLCAEAARDAFGVTAYDGETGLTEGELIRVLTEYVWYLSHQKKSTSHLPITSDAMDTSQASDLPMNNDSDCSSISSEPRPDEPAPSPSA